MDLGRPFFLFPCRVHQRVAQECFPMVYHSIRMLIDQRRDGLMEVWVSNPLTLVILTELEAILELS